jgi:spore maturation protein CgeB
MDLFLRQNAYIVAKILKKLKLSSLALSLPGVRKAFYLDVMPGNPKNIHLIKKNSKPPLYGFEMFKVLFHSKIGFNYHGQVAGDYAANMRLFEVTGVGSCLITDWKKNLNDLFEIDKEVVAFKSAEECVEKVKWLLNNPKEREAIAKAGQQRVLKDHTLESRVRLLDEIIRKELS